jgi:RNA polymerase sigma-70 factor (ECF subfamily)
MCRRIPRAVVSTMDEPDAPTSPAAASQAPSDAAAESSVELLARARQQDQDAVERLCARYLPILTRWARGRLPDWARDALETGDIVQDTLLRSLKHLDHFEHRRAGAFNAYLRQALVNRIRDEVRRAQRRPAPVDLQYADHTDEAPSPFDQAVGRETMDRYDAALELLTPEDREAIICRIEFEWSYAEVAAALGKPSEDAARMAVSRALVRLGAEMARLERAPS